MVSKADVCELMRVLTYPKFRLDVAERQVVLAAYLPHAETIGVGVRFGGARCRDQYDEMFLSLAARGDAGYLVSGDADLLSLKDFAVCPIITLEQFRQKITCR